MMLDMKGFAGFASTNTNTTASTTTVTSALQRACGCCYTTSIDMIKTLFRIMFLSSWLSLYVETLRLYHFF